MVIYIYIIIIYTYLLLLGVLLSLLLLLYIYISIPKYISKAIIASAVSTRPGPPFFPEPRADRGVRWLQHATKASLTAGKAWLRIANKKNDGTMDQNPSKSMWFLCQFFAPSVNVCFFPRKTCYYLKNNKTHQG